VENPVIGETVTHYRIVKKIGGGGMGIVYQAEDTKLKRTVALKFLPPELTRAERAKKRFLREAQAASALDHPNICSIYEIDETPAGQLFIAMACYEGESLKDRIARAPLPSREAFEVAFCIADGLGAAHDRGIVHRDVKPGNVMITNDGFVKVVDFGLAKLRGASRVTRSGFTPGTIAYMSPEQAKSGEVDERTDIWALGVVTYEMLTGELPFRGDVEQALVYSIINEDPTPLRDRSPDAPRGFASIIEKCLAKKPEDRYQTMAELTDALRELAVHEGWQSSGSFRSAIRVGRHVPFGRRRARWVVGAALVAVASVAIWSLWPRPAPSPFVTKVRLAVMPFESLAGAGASEAFASGLSEQIAFDLDRTSDLHESMWVLPFTQTAPGQVATLSDVKDAFGVNRVLTGSVQRFEDGFRLSMELVDAASLEPLANADIDFGPDDVAAVTRRALAALADLLGFDLDAAQLERLTAGGTSDNDASRGFLEALGYLQKYRASGYVENAMNALEQALATDSNFVNARAALGYACWRNYRVTRDAQWRDRARRESRLAADTDTLLLYPATAHLDITYWSGEYEATVARGRAILAVDPHDSEALVRVARALTQLQRLDEARVYLERLIETRPDYYQGYRHIGYFLSELGRDPEAIPYYETALSFAPNHVGTLKSISAIYIREQRLPEARKALQRAFAISPDCYTCSVIGSVAYQQAQYAEAVRYYEFALTYCDSTDADQYIRWNDLGDALYWTEGRREEAYPKYSRALALAERQEAKGEAAPDLLAYIGGLHAVLGHADSARTYAERAAALAGTDGAVMLTIGWTYEMLRDRDRALHYIGQALRFGLPPDRVENEPLLKDLTQDEIYQRTLAGLQHGQEERTTQ